MDCRAADSAVFFDANGLDLIQTLIDLDRLLFELKSQSSITEMDNGRPDGVPYRIP